MAEEKATLPQQKNNLIQFVPLLRWFFLKLPLEKEERSLMVFDRLQAEPLKSLMETAAVIVTWEERKVATTQAFKWADCISLAAKIEMTTLNIAPLFSQAPLGYYMACNGEVGEGIGQSAFVLRSTAVSPIFSTPSSAVLLKKSLGKWVISTLHAGKTLPLIFN